METRIKAFTKLGEVLRTYQVDQTEENKKFYNSLDLNIQKAKANNPWFTSENIILAIQSIGESLKIENLNKWLLPYSAEIQNLGEAKNVAVIMAGNIPLVGFHDFLSVVISGHSFLGKLSSDDEHLLPGIVEVLTAIEPLLSDKIEFADGKIQNFDAVIATGSNNSSRYFDYYFGKYPNIIRKNRNGVAVLTGDETPEQLQSFGNDIFQYFGMGCRSVSKLFVPENYSFDLLFQSIESFSEIGNHNKYKNNYDYYRSIYLINQVKHFDNGLLMITEDTPYASPPSVMYYEYYTDIKELKQKLVNDSEQIQCVVSQSSDINNSIPLGEAQQPALWDYADGVDTMKFLMNFSETFKISSRS